MPAGDGSAEAATIPVPPAGLLSPTGGLGGRWAGAHLAGLADGEQVGAAHLPGESVPGQDAWGAAGSGVSRGTDPTGPLRPLSALRPSRQPRSLAVPWEGCGGSSAAPGAAKAALTVHPGVRTQGADAGRGLAGVGDGLAGGPGVEVDVDRHRGAGEDQQPDDGQDVGDAHKLQGAGQAGGTAAVTVRPGMGTGEREGPQAGGEGAGRARERDAASAWLCTARRARRIPLHPMEHRPEPGWLSGTVTRTWG